METDTHTEKILITGALGQIGTELTNRLVEIHGAENVIASGLDRWDKKLTSAGFYERMDVSNTQLVRQVCKDYEITTVYHLASLLSGTSERQPVYQIQRKNRRNCKRRTVPDMEKRNAAHGRRRQRTVSA